jgi:hypothetical protein
MDRTINSTPEFASLPANPITRRDLVDSRSVDRIAGGAGRARRFARFWKRASILRTGANATPGSCLCPPPTWALAKSGCSRTQR